MTTTPRDVLVEAWSGAGLPGEALEALLGLLDDGSEGQLRVEGERVLAAIIQPGLDEVYAQARTKGADLDGLEARRLALAAVYASLRFVGAIHDQPHRDPEMTVQTAARRRRKA